MHCTGFSKRIHRSIQVISVCLSSANQINPQLAYASVDLSPKLPGRGGKASSTIPLIPQLALFLQLIASVKERAQTHNWGSREMVEPRTLNFESTLTAAERNTIMIWWGLGDFFIINLGNINLSKYLTGKLALCCTKGTKFPNQHTTVIYCIRLPLPSVKHSSCDKV